MLDTVLTLLKKINYLEHKGTKVNYSGLKMEDYWKPVK